jgi:predicted nucleotide-binding protein
VDRLHTAIDDALGRTFGVDTHDYERYKYASEFDNGPFNYIHKVPIHGVQASLARSRAKNISVIEGVIESLRERRAEVGPNMPPDQAGVVKSIASRRVFVVHGHDEAARETVARFLKAAEFDPIILHEQANQGRTVIEKVEAHGDVGSPVVLLPPDDTGAAQGEIAEPRARQNVLLELGYFIGRLGRNRVCALKKGNLEIPSDFGGVVYEALDAGNGWKLALGRELKAAGYEFSFDKALR